MSFKDIAEIATSLSLIVASLTLIFTFIERSSRERRREISDWQRIVVYETIAEGASTFSEIKTSYVVAAQQYARLPKTDIQDSSLRLALMSLAEARLISVTDHKTYVANRVLINENLLKEMTYIDFVKKSRIHQVLSPLYDLLRHEGGKYTVDELHKLLKAAELGYTYEDFNVLVQQNYILSVSKDNKVSFEPRPRPPPP